MHVVVARYEENLDWIVTDLLPLFPPFSVFVHVYNKGASPVVIDHPNVVVIPTENVGREMHTYLHHIIQTYHENHPLDITLFLPGSCHQLEYKWNMMLRIIDHWKNTGRIDSAFVCNWIPVTRTFMEEYTVNEYRSSDPQNLNKNPESFVKPCSIRPYGRWYRAVFGESIRETACVTRFGIFAASHRHIAQRPRAFYERLIAFANDHSNPEAGHYLEWTWPAIFQPIPRHCFIIVSHKKPSPVPVGLMALAWAWVLVGVIFFSP